MFLTALILIIIVILTFFSIALFSILGMFLSIPAHFILKKEKEEIEKSGK